MKKLLSASKPLDISPRSAYAQSRQRVSAGACLCQKPALMPFHL